MQQRFVRVFVCASLCFLTSCIGGWGVAEDRTLGGPYHLMAVDTEEQMSLVVCNRYGCFGHEKTSPTVFAAGINKNFVTYARHPANDFGELVPPYATQYYYILRSTDEERGLSDHAIVGPIGEAEFKRRARALNLPSFSVVYDALK